MTDSEKIQILLEKSAIMEEAIKMLLMNDVLKDAENLTASPSDFSQQQEEYEKKITELQKILKIKDDKIISLQSQIETQKRRIQTLQELSDSKDRTIKAKEERIQILQKQSGTPKKAETFKHGETVKLHPSCKAMSLT